MSYGYVIYTYVYMYIIYIYIQGIKAILYLGPINYCEDLCTFSCLPVQQCAYERSSSPKAGIAGIHSQIPTQKTPSLNLKSDLLPWRTLSASLTNFRLEMTIGTEIELKLDKQNQIGRFLVTWLVRFLYEYKEIEGCALLY